jgi:hypothetical protein
MAGRRQFGQFGEFDMTSSVSIQEVGSCNLESDAGAPACFWSRYKKDILVVGGILLVAGVLLGLMLNRFLTVVNHDAAIFCILGQSILNGHYLLVSEPNPQPYFTFPPLLSLQLAGLMALFGNRDIQAMQLVFKGYISLLFLFSMPVFYVWVRQMVGRSHAMILTALVAVNPIIFKYTSDVLSDTPYWAFSMGAIYAAWRFQKSSEANTGKPLAWYFATVALIILCALTRQIGMALVLGFLISLGLRKQWKLAVLSVMLFAVTVGGWQSYEHFYRSAHRSDIDSLNQQGVQQVLDKSPIKLEYVKHFLVDRPVNYDENRFQTSPLILLENAWNRVQAYTKHSLDQFLPELKVRINGSKVNLAHFWLFMLGFWLLLLPGLRNLFRVFPFAGLYLTLYMAVLMVYPYISVRFILPTFPLILLCAYWGLVTFKEKLEQPESKPFTKKLALALVPVFVILSLIAVLPDTIRRVQDGYKLKVADQGPSLRKGNKAYYETLLWLKANTPEDSLIISRKPPVTYYYSDRKSTAFPFTADTEKLFDYVQEKQTRYGKQFSGIYIFEDTAFGESKRFLQPMVEKHRDRLTLVYTESATQSRVWRLK